MLHSSMAALGNALGFGGFGSSSTAGSVPPHLRSAGKVDRAGAGGGPKPARGGKRVVVGSGPTTLRGPGADLDPSDRPEGWLPSDDYALDPFRSGH